MMNALKKMKTRKEMNIATEDLITIQEMKTIMETDAKNMCQAASTEVHKEMIMATEVILLTETEIIQTETVAILLTEIVAIQEAAITLPTGTEAIHLTEDQLMTEAILQKEDMDRKEAIHQTETTLQMGGTTIRDDLQDQDDHLNHVLREARQDRVVHQAVQAERATVAEANQAQPTLAHAQDQKKALRKDKHDNLKK